jgi:hypothetical protein
VWKGSVILESLLYTAKLRIHIGVIWGEAELEFIEVGAGVIDAPDDVVV